MPAQYPTSIRTFTNKVDLVDTVFADHINVLQDEVRAIASTFGNLVLTSNYTGTFTQTTSWSTVGARLANIEAGLVSGVVGSPYFKKTGDTITPPSGSVALTLKTTAGTSNLLEARTAANSVGFSIDYNGVPKVGGYNVLYVGSTEYTSLSNTATEAQVTSKGNPFNPFLLAGL